ncbi:MAG: hypothetical protein KC613_26240, partial [Myxococcales bacterium]|nr:hypothetical protein [Myxococcales bacterium]
MLNALGFAVDRNRADERVQATIKYIGRNFNNGTPDCWGGQNLGNYYAMYQISKGMRSPVPPVDLIELDDDGDGVTDRTVDWYDQYVDFLLGSPDADGRFRNDNRWMGAREIVHGLGLLILIPSIFESPPVAVANANPRSVGPGDVITFNHRSSYNPDPTVPIVTYRWNFIDYPVGLDLNGDGDFDDEGEFPPEDLNGDGQVTNDEVVWEVVTRDRDRTPTFAFDPELEFGEERVYRVVLQVEDVLGRVGIDDESVVIRVAIINHPPVALPHPSGDPDAAYQVVPGRTYTLDGSASFDPDSDDEPVGDFPPDSITYYGWDLNLDGQYEVEGETAQFAVPADWQVGDIRTVRFLVCDDGTWAGLSDEECEGDCSLCSRQTARLRVVPNTPPTAAVDQGPRIPEGERRIVRAEPQGPGGAPVSYEWICPEGVAFQVIEDGAAIEVDAAAIDGIEDGTEIGCRLVVRDDLGDSASVAFTVTVTNRPPEIEAVQADGRTQEGGSATITIAATDPAAADRAGLLYSVDCDGDGILDVIDSPDPVIECVYGDNGVYEPVVLVTDDDGGMAIAPAGQVVVDNVGPRVAAVECPPSREGIPVTVQIPVDDPGGAHDPITCELLAPVPVNAAIDAQRCLVQWTPTYDQAVAGEIQFTVRVSDDDGASAELGFVCRPQWRDEDGDGLPDSWEEDHGLDPTVNDCLLDADGDGINNCDEFDQGSDPQVPWRVAVPVLLAPIDGEAVPTVTPDLLLENVDNPLGRPISYQYRVFADAELSAQVAESDWVAEAQPGTAWDVPADTLQDNTRYWWTARADDGVQPSAWAEPAEFVVDDGPDRPTPPTILWPEDGDQIGDPQPDVTVANSQDPDPDETLTYGCEISKNPDFQPVATRASGPEGQDGTTTMTVEDPLDPNVWYYVRCRAIDSSGLTSEWSEPVRFSIGVVNEPPGPPTIIKPEHALVTDITRWVLVAGNAVDPDGDALTYKFWLSTDPGFQGEDTWESGEIVEGPDGETAWPAPPELQDQTTYFWRVRARDARVAGPAVTARFTVDLGNGPPSVPVPVSPAAE